MRSILLILIHVILLLEESSSAAAVTRSTVFAIRGGSSWSRTATPIRPTSTRPSSSSNIRYPVVQDLNPDDDRSDTYFLKAESRERTKEMMDAFLTRDSRNSFIARVYAILSVQLLVTAVSVVLFGTHPAFLRLHNPAAARIPLTLSLIVSTISWFLAVASPTARRKAPFKWQLLAFFTLGEAVTVGFLTSFYKFRSVVASMLATVVATLAISIYTVRQRNPKYDLSQWSAGLSSCGLIFLAFGLLQLLEVFGIIPRGFIPFHEGLYSFVGACLFSFYLAYHTKLIVAGKHSKYQMNEQDYVFGAMCLYSDVINMFLYILRMIGEDKEK